MRKRLSILAVIVGIAGLLTLGLSSCAIQSVVTATGYILDTSTGGGISGATVTLDNSGTGTSYSVSPTASDGSYSIPLVAPGLYKVTVSVSGYYFPPMQVTLQKGQTTVPTIPGVPLTTANISAGTIYFVLTWQNGNAPLELQMTYPASDLSDNADTAFDNPYYDIATNWSSGFGVEPSVAAGNRAITNSTYSTGSNSGGTGYHTITMGATNSSGGPMTINMPSFPFPYTNSPSYPILATAQNGLTAFGLASTTGFEWYGVGELYISSSSSTYPVSSSDGTSGADPTVYVVQATASGTLLGTFTLPNYTTISATSIIRVDFFRDNSDPTYYDFLIVPDTQIVPGGAGTSGANLRSATSAPSVIAVRAKGM